MSVADSNSPQFMVYEALRCLCSQETSLFKSAEGKLAEWEVQSGFYTTITQIIFAYNQVDTNIRWMATVYLKNGITKYWRKNAPNGIAENEKREIRRLILVDAFREPIPQVAVQMAVLVGCISRYDYPDDWVELMPRLNEIIGSMDSQQQQRGLLLLQNVVKSLASKRLRNDRRIFREFATEIFPCAVDLWTINTQHYLQCLDENASIEQSQIYLDKAIIVLRILRKFVAFGVVEPKQSEPCSRFMNALIPCMNRFVEYRARLLDRHRQRQTENGGQDWNRLIELTERFILKSMRILSEFLETHAEGLPDFITMSLEFAFNYVFYTGTQFIFDANNQINFHNFAINCINLMKQVALKNASENDAPTLKSEAKINFFTKERLTYISEKVVTYYFLLTPKDLEVWDDDAEQYAHDEAGESWKYDLRPCTESFYLTLFSQYRVEMVADLVKYIQQAQAITLHPESTADQVFMKDAIYKAAGLSSFNLFDEINFDEWFAGQLLQELSVPVVNARILRRRVIWLIGQWTSVKFDKSLRPKVYEICLHLLRTDEDICVRLTACKTLMNTLNDFEFESVQFVDYVQPTFSSLFTLLKEARECDTKMSVLNGMSVIFDKMGEKLSNDAESLCHYLPMLWHESDDHNMLRCAILSALLQVIIAISEIPPFLSPFLYPVISMSTNQNEPSHIYFLEDALELWLAVVQNSTVLTPELLSLTGNLLPIIETSSEYIRTVFSIIQAYILLNSEVFLQQHGKAIINTCQNLLTDMRSEGIVMVMRLYESILRAIGNFGVELLRPALPNIFRRVIENEEWQMVMSAYLTIVARVLIMDQVAFSQVLQEMKVENPVGRLLDVWVRKMPLIGQPDKRKLLSLALASLITVQNDTIYQKFDVIIQAICESLNDIMKEECDVGTNSQQMIDSLILTEDDEIDTDGLFRMEHTCYNTHHYNRCRHMCLKDPVHTIVLLHYFQAQLSQARSTLGDDRYRALVSSVDASVIENLKEFKVHMETNDEEVLKRMSEFNINQAS